MKIAELTPRQGKVELEAKIVELSVPRTIAKPNFNGRVASAKIEDDSGTIALTLWNDDIEKFSVGDRIKVTNGFVNEWQGEMQLSAGKFGKLEKL